MKSYRVIIQHRTDGHIITRPATQVPQKGNIITISPDQYVVTSVIWNYADGSTVILIVDTPEDALL